MQSENLRESEQFGLSLGMEARLSSLIEAASLLNILLAADD